MTTTSHRVCTFDIAVLPGDGIGVHVTREAVRMLPALETGHGGMNRAGVKPMETDTGNSKLRGLWEIANLPSKPQHQQT